MKGFKKELPLKTCRSCGRPFSWRKKWRNNWEEITCCSERCRRQKKPSTDVSARIIS